MFEVLFIEDSVYHVRHYTDRECKPINLKLSKDEFIKFSENRREV